MKKILPLLLFISFLPCTAFSGQFKATPEILKEAAHIRAAAISMGMNKADPKTVIGQFGEIGGVEREFTEAEIEALSCVYKKTQELQFTGPIEVFARFLNDEDFEKQTIEMFEKECGLDKITGK